MIDEIEEIKDRLDDVLEEAQLRARTIGKINSVISDSILNSDGKLEKICEIIDEYLND